MGKRVLAMAMAILAFFIFVGSPFGQSAKAIVGVDDAIIAIIIAALAAMGITFVASASYGSLEEYVGSLMEEYASSRGATFNQLLTGTQTASNRLGQILLNNRFVILVSSFGVWLKSKFSLADNTTTNVVAGTSTWGGLDVYLMPVSVAHRTGDPVYEYVVYRASGSSVYGLFRQNGSTVTLQFLSKGPAEIQRITYRPDGSFIEDSPTALTYYSAVQCYSTTSGSFNPANYPVLNSVSVYTAQEIDAALRGEIETGGAPIDIVTGVIDLPTERNDFDDEGAVLDLDAPWGLGYDDLTDVVIPGLFTDGAEADTDITYQEEDEVAQQVEDTPTQSVSQEVNDYQTPGLQSVFPFCIPFDIYAFFECLAAEPEAPSFTWRFYIPGICDEDLEIDLAAFDSAARILRTMELLLFIVGLAFVTRDKFLRG